MKDYFIVYITKLHGQEPAIVEREYEATFKKPYKEEDLELLSNGELKNFYRSTKHIVAIDTSPLTIEQIEEILLASEKQQGA